MIEWILILVMILAVLVSITLLLVVWLIGYLAEIAAELQRVRTAEGFHASSAKPWEPI
jgi:hypothetical protein